ncbi:MAG: hypothetical protein JXA20_13260 [Spirochaetes bacterium]|nr:hypothetical protein [Spirochaetota bacterium]
MPSTAAQIIVSIIPIVGIVTGGAVLFFYMLWNHKQRMMLIDKGLVPQSPFDLLTFSLFAGLILFSIGVSLVVFFVMKEGFSYGVLSGIIPLSIGVSLVVFFSVRLRMKKNDPK